MPSLWQTSPLTEEGEGAVACVPSDLWGTVYSPNCGCVPPLYINALVLGFPAVCSRLQPNVTKDAMQHWDHFLGQKSVTTWTFWFVCLDTRSGQRFPLSVDGKLVCLSELWREFLATDWLRHARLEVSNLLIWQEGNWWWLWKLCCFAV